MINTTATKKTRQWSKSTNHCCDSIPQCPYHVYRSNVYTALTFNFIQNNKKLKKKKKKKPDI